MSGGADASLLLLEGGGKWPNIPMFGGGMSVTLLERLFLIDVLHARHSNGWAGS